MLLLALETATDVCSAALFRGDALVGEATVREPRSHAARLAPMVRDLLAGAEAGVADPGSGPGQALGAVAVSAGPGSFTGLRIGVGTAKGLAFAGGAALVAVPTLEALAAAGGPSDRPVLAALPSRRGEVYAGLYRVGDGGVGVLAEAAALDLGAVAGWLGEAVAPGASLALLGSGAARVAEAVGEAFSFRVVEAEPSAVHVGRLGRARFRRGETENVAAFEPYYLKAFVPRPPKPIFPS